MAVKKATVLICLAVFLGATAPALSRVPNDLNYPDQAMMWKQINAPAGWDITTGSREVIVAVIDTGVDTWHNDLRDNIWTNRYEIPDNGLDDDDNGYVDDRHGWNFVANSPDVRTSVFDNAADPEAIRHGTVIAGLIGAVGDNNRNGTGLSWQVSIMPLRAIDSEGNGLPEQVVRAVDYARENGARVISMSFVSNRESAALTATLRRAYDAGIVIVAAAGNNRLLGKGNLDQSPVYPACADRNDADNWIIGVSAVGADDQLSSFADYGSCSDLVAPGESVFSTERYAPQFGYQREFGGDFKGTSFAAPFVAGAAALIANLHPEWSAAQITERLIKTARPLSVETDKISSAIVYKLDVGAALASAALASPPPALLPMVWRRDAHHLIGYDFASNESYSFGRIQNATILSVTNWPIMPPRPWELAVLLERSGRYFVRLLQAGTNNWYEWVLPKVIDGAKAQKKKFSSQGSYVRVAALRRRNGDRSLIVEFYNPRAKMTQLAEFTLAGDLVRQRTISGLLAGWDTAKRAPILAYATLERQILKLHRLDWETGVATTYIEPGIVRLRDLALEDSSGDSAPVLLLAERGQALELQRVNLANNSLERRALPTKLKGAKALLVGIHAAAGEDAVVWPFLSAGGLMIPYTMALIPLDPVDPPPSGEIFN